MVRSVEPDPPNLSPKLPERVRGTTATPEQLGQTSVREQGERSGRRKEKPKGPPLETDSVTLEHPATPGESGKENERSEPHRPAGKPGGPNEHVDLKG